MKPSVLLALCWLAGGCALLPLPVTLQPESWRAAPAEQRAAIEERLDWAGENRQELLGYLDGVPEEERWAAWFLVANLPPRDLGAVTAGQLLANHRLAFRARRELPWAGEPSDQLFLHYVLPYHVSQEPIQPWREHLYEAVTARVASLRTAAQAALEINRWAAEHISFKQTEFRDQGPLTSLTHGIGRCEEMMILYIAAARTVGLPARPCSTPWWPFTDNNHAWVEVYGDGAWHYLGGAEPRPALDDGWFGNSALRTVMVRSVAFGTGGELGEALYRTGADFTLVNSTANYTSPCTIQIYVSADGEAAVNVPVYLAVFNYGAFRTVAMRETDGSGLAEFITGPGQMLASAGTDEKGAVAVVTGDPEAPSVAILRLDETSMDPPETLWLRYPPPPEGR
ncbi:transglutaminase domain-containing protein [bacterium]|nr:transglutaminase domain-containing protein [candidate division CSSED10-310 bacterium]